MQSAKAYLERLNQLYRAEDYDALTLAMESEEEISLLAAMIQDLDLYLTGSKRATLDRYHHDALQVLQADTAIVHLSDGGYSRLMLSYVEKGHIWLDRSLSTPRVISRYNQAYPIG